MHGRKKKEQQRDQVVHAAYFCADKTPDAFVPRRHHLPTKSSFAHSIPVAAIVVVVAVFVVVAL